MSEIKQISPWQFAVFRIVFGSYLFVHFLQLIPWAGELFSNQGLLPDPRLNFTFGVLPNPLEIWQSAEFVQFFVRIMALLAMFFALGIRRRTSAFLLWYGWACLFNRNNLISNPGIPYVGLLLLLCVLIPTGEPLAMTRRRDDRWCMPATIFWGAWLLLATGYTYSGIWKLHAPSWIDGSALYHLLHNPLARPGVMRDLLLQLPDWTLRGLTWIALIGELLALPLSFTRKGRAVAWIGMLAMHLGILFVVDFADLTFGMLMIHFFTFDPDWLPARKGCPALVLFDRACGLCDRTVQFLIGEDSRGILRFAPLQGETAKPILQKHNFSTVSWRSMILIENPGAADERLFFKSDAFLRTLAKLGGFWHVVSWLCWAPRFVRDAAYDFIAARRHRLLASELAACRLPNRDERARLLP